LDLVVYEGIKVSAPSSCYAGCTCQPGDQFKEDTKQRTLQTLPGLKNGPIISDPDKNKK